MKSAMADRPPKTVLVMPNIVQCLYWHPGPCYPWDPLLTHVECWRAFFNVPYVWEDEGCGT